MKIMRTSCRISYRISWNPIGSPIGYPIGYPICCRRIPIGHPLLPRGSASCLQVPSQLRIRLYCVCALNQGGGFSTQCFYSPFQEPGPPGAARSRRPGARSSGSAQLTNPPVSSGRITQEHAWKRSMGGRGGERRGTRNRASGERWRSCVS